MTQQYATAKDVPALDASSPRQYVHPGSLFFATREMLISTILGSCVSLCLHHAESGAAGLNHYLLPAKTTTDSPRFGDVANAMLLRRFEELGISPRSLRAKIFGGASMGMIQSDLAARNVEAAFTFCQATGIPVVGSDTGGDRGRKLLLRTTDAAAWVRIL